MRRSLRRLGRADGFSLIEVLAAAGLISLVALGFAAGAERGVRYSSYNRNLGAATALAQDKMEELRSRNAGDLQLLDGAHADPLNPLTALGTAGGLYTRRWTVMDNMPATGLKTIAMTVTWTAQGETHRVRLVAVKS